MTLNCYFFIMMISFIFPGTKAIGLIVILNISICISPVFHIWEYFPSIVFKSQHCYCSKHMLSEAVASLLMSVNVS